MSQNAYNTYSTPKLDFTKTLDTSSLKNATALVTGGASGIGLGIVTALAEAGAYVTIADVSAKGEEVAEELRAKGGHVIFVHTDTTSYESQLAAFKKTISHSPNSTVDIVVPAAGIASGRLPDEAAHKDAPLAPDADPPPPDIRCYNVNLIGVHHTTYLALHYFYKTAADNASADKQILLVSSMAGYSEFRSVSVYNAAKHGVRGLWKSLRHVTGNWANVRVNLLAPTFVETPIVAGVVGILKASGYKMASVADSTDAVMRILSDKSVSARAICVAQAPEGGAVGSGNFDLEDNPAQGDGALALDAAQKRDAFMYPKGEK